MRNKLFIIIFLIGIVSAVSAPHGFYGGVAYSNGTSAGGTVTAKIENVVVGNSVISNGLYDLVVEADAGIVYFYLGNDLIGNYTFDAFDVTELNFTIDVDGGGGTGGTTQTSSTTSTTSRSSHSRKPQVKVCDVSWECSGWGECVSGLRTRQCYDKNHCDYSYNKPVEETLCDFFSRSLVEKEEDFNFVLFGIFSALILMGLVILLLVVT